MRHLPHRQVLLRRRLGEPEQVRLSQRLALVKCSTFVVQIKAKNRRILVIRPVAVSSKVTKNSRQLFAFEV